MGHANLGVPRVACARGGEGTVGGQRPAEARSDSESLRERCRHVSGRCARHVARVRIVCVLRTRYGGGESMEVWPLNTGNRGGEKVPRVVVLEGLRL
eukprot:6516163-Prymnesium_polylepis.1